MTGKWGVLNSMTGEEPGGERDGVRVCHLTIQPLRREENHQVCAAWTHKTFALHTALLSLLLQFAALYLKRQQSLEPGVAR